MSELIDSYRELLAQTRHFLTTTLADGKQWIHADPRGFVDLQQTPRQPAQPATAAAAQRPVPPQRVTPVPVSVPASTPVLAPKVPAPMPPSAPAPPKKPALVDTLAVADAPASESETGKKPFSLTPAPPATAPELNDLKKLISAVAPVMRLIDAVPAAVATSIHRVPDGAIALILTPKYTSAEVNAFLEAVAKAVELRFGPCGILDSHALVSAKQGFPPPGPRLIPIADPTIYLREPMRKAELWNDIRRKLGKPTPRS